ncbi:MAG: tRNA lysidine(34) synthetase TilS [Candidatus Cloacimonetes bacterium]|nr:tRNA lysidine(34) synthetase TilS [Candidatus Cloacimonadota bacterium]
MNPKFNFIEEVESFCKEHNLFKKGDKILIGFSGGADSTALLLAFSYLRTKYHLSLLVAHVNYNLRGEDSIADENFVKEICFAHNISLVIKNVKLENLSNMENTAREIRMDYFSTLTELYKVNRIALGHNKEDQAETILFRLIRGAVFNGLKGILPKNRKIIHPLLGVNRFKIVDFLKSENSSWQTDKSNLNNDYSRNKIRNHIIPWIEEHLNSKVVEKLYNTSVIFRETDSILNDLAKRKLFKSILRKHKDGIKLSLIEILKTRSVLRFYIFRDVYRQICGTEKDFYQTQFIEIESILKTSGSKQIMLPHNIIVIKEYDSLIFIKKGSLISVDIDYKRELTSIRSRFSFENYRINMKKIKKLPTKRHQFENKEEAFLDLDKIKFPFTLRHRKDGDKFIPLGMNHSKKLKDFFIDEKVPKFERDNVIIFTDNEKIIWVGGMRIDNRVAISNKTKNILKIRIDEISSHKLRHAERNKK